VVASCVWRRFAEPLPHEVPAVFFEPSQTQFDLRFRLFGIGVRVSPWFWVMSAVLG